MNSWAARANAEQRLALALETVLSNLVVPPRTLGSFPRDAGRASPSGSWVTRLTATPLSRRKNALQVFAKRGSLAEPRRPATELRAARSAPALAGRQWRFSASATQPASVIGVYRRNRNGLNSANNGVSVPERRVWSEMPNSAAAASLTAPTARSAVRRRSPAEDWSDRCPRVPPGLAPAHTCGVRRSANATRCVAPWNSGC